MPFLLLGILVFLEGVLYWILHRDQNSAGLVNERGKGGKHVLYSIE